MSKLVFLCTITIFIFSCKGEDIDQLNDLFGTWQRSEIHHGEGFETTKEEDGFKYSFLQDGSFIRSIGYKCLDESGEDQRVYYGTFDIQNGTLSLDYQCNGNTKNIDYQYEITKNGNLKMIYTLSTCHGCYEIFNKTSNEAIDINDQ